MYFASLTGSNGNITSCGNHDGEVYDGGINASFVHTAAKTKGYDSQFFLLGLNKLNEAKERGCMALKE